MKTLLFGTLVTVVATTALAQGKVRFGNDSNHLIVYSHWAGPGLTGTPVNLGPCTAELLAGTSASSLAVVCTVVPAGTADYPDGLLANVLVTLTNIPPGIPAYFQVRIWETALGSYERARCGGVRYLNGSSPVFTAVPGVFFPSSIWSPRAPSLSTWANAPILVPPDYLDPQFVVSIWSPPISQEVVRGKSVSFSVEVCSNYPVNYQWLFNGIAIPGANAPTYQITNAQPANAGSYSVNVWNSWGAAASTAATLIVFPDVPVLLASPRDQTPFVGYSLDLTADVSGAPPLTYQWFFDGTAIPSGVDATLHLNNLQFSQSGTYVAIITNAFGAVTSTPAMVTVMPRPLTPPAGKVVGWGALAIPYVPPATRFTAVAAGSGYSLAVKSDSTVVAWGANGAGQCTVPAGLSNVIALAGGGVRLENGRSLALKSDGSVLAWGDNNNGHYTVPAGLSNVIAIAVGYVHSLALRSDGTVVAWGDNPWGQTNVPADLNGAIAIAAGEQHSLALKSDGTVVAWGDNGWGQCTVPAGLSNVIAIAAGHVHSLALKSDGTVASWGCLSQTNVPADLRGVIAIAAGGWHSLALRFDGSVVPMGFYAPEGLSNVVAIAAGEDHNLALKSDGTIIAWGSNDYGETIAPGSLTGVIALASGGSSTCRSMGLKSDGTVVAWGLQGYGLSNVLSLSGVIAVASGEYHDLALKSDGTVVAWGANNNGQTNVPAGTGGALAVAAGGYHTLVLKSDHTVAAWGDNNDDCGNFAGQSTVPTNLDNVIAISAGESHSLALRSDGTVVAWGSNSNCLGGYFAGQSTLPMGLNGVIAIAAGLYHSLALRSDGTVVAWGDNSWGQSSVPTGLRSAVAIAAGLYHSLALKSDGTVVGWGGNYNGLTALPAGLPPVIAIGAGPNLGLGLLADSPVVQTPPASQTAEAGSRVEFQVCAAGLPVLAYQWFFNGASIPSCMNSALQLTNVKPSQAGAYTVVVTNGLGAATSTPAFMNVIPPVARRTVPALALMTQPGASLNLEFTGPVVSSPVWTPLETVQLTSASQWYFDLSVPLPPQRLYRAWYSEPLAPPPALRLHMVPAIALTGALGSTLRLDYINQFGPTDAWVTLDTVTLTNTSQLYFDTSSLGQPPRLWRIVQVP